MAYNKFKKNISYLYLVICLILFNLIFNTSCGLETFYQILSPEIPSGFQLPTFESDVNNRVFKFNTTQKSDNGGGLSFQGTEIYYKIYADKNHMITERDKLISLSDEAKKNYSTAPADKLILTNGYGYGYTQLFHKVKGEKKSSPWLISGKDLHEVEFRLTNAGKDFKDELQAHIIIDGHNYNEVPVRYNGKSFNFNEDKIDSMSTSEKDIYKESTGNKDGKWYVPLFAVSRGHDATYTNYYSNITYLGTVYIDDSHLSVN